MKKFAKLFLLLFLAATLCTFAADNTFKKQMDKLEPFAGKWKTRSIYPDNGLEVPGDLEHRWVLGKTWMLVEFVGKHPKRDYWEAYSMIKFDTAKNCYVSYDFFNGNDPVIMKGKWIAAKTIRFESKNEKGSSGIDYTFKKDGTIYQENWSAPQNGKEKVRLKTYYTRVR